MIICVSGTPGTGKTTLSKRIAKDFELLYIDGNDIIKKYRLSEGFDKKKNCKIIDAKKFATSVIKESRIITKNIVVDSHLSHHLPSRNVDLCVICKTNLKTLKQRLLKRRYSQSKVRENLDAEIFDVCYVEAIENNHTVVISNKNYNSLKIKIGKLIAQKRL